MWALKTKVMMLVIYITCKKSLKQFNKIHLKYVDDLLVAEAVNLKENLENIPPQERILPDDFHTRTGHHLPVEKSEVYEQLLKTKKYAEENQMQLNLKKTKLMLFNPSRNWDFYPHFNIEGNDIELVDQTRLLGVVLQSDLTWSAHIEHVVLKCNKKLWILRGLKKLGADDDDLKEIYITQIRSILEYAAPVWHSSLTGAQIQKLERVQKSALHIIHADNYKSYEHACEVLSLETLNTKRENLCTKFAKRSLKSKKLTTWFKVNTKIGNTRSKQPKLCNVFSRTNRFKNSPISYMTSILNKEAK